jgi:hypothetical protein
MSMEGDSEDSAGGQNNSSCHGVRPRDSVISYLHTCCFSDNITYAKNAKLYGWTWLWKSERVPLDFCQAKDYMTREE